MKILVVLFPIIIEKLHMKECLKAANRMHMNNIYPDVILV